VVADAGGVEDDIAVAGVHHTVAADFVHIFTRLIAESFEYTITQRT
jgi:hypothetical protein